MKLLNDISLCAARFDFNAELTEWCTRRHDCQRYQQFINWEEGESIQVSVFMGRPDCPEFIQVEQEK